MTVTVNVRTRAVGATVKIGEVETEVAPRSNKSFFADGTLELTITEATPSADAPVDKGRPLDGEKVPGQEENDKLHPPATDASSETKADTDSSKSGRKPFGKS